MANVRSWRSTIQWWKDIPSQARMIAKWVVCMTRRLFARFSTTHRRSLLHRLVLREAALLFKNPARWDQGSRQSSKILGGLYPQLHQIPGRLEALVGCGESKVHEGLYSRSGDDNPSNVNQGRAGVCGASTIRVPTVLLGLSKTTVRHRQRSRLRDFTRVARQALSVHSVIQHRHHQERHSSFCYNRRKRRSAPSRKSVADGPWGVCWSVGPVHAQYENTQAVAPGSFEIGARSQTTTVFVFKDCSGCPGHPFHGRQVQ